jgi:NADH:ubiquinone oxidoreductase subunit B-like Fe-S oxidoreductase
MRVRMVKRPTTGDCDLEGFDVSRFEVGEVYEVGPRLAELLIVCGYAEPEMRPRDRAAEQSRRPK